MELNRKELKKIIYDFNSISNRLMQADCSEYRDILRKFLAFIDNTEIIYDYIKDCGEPIYDIPAEVEEVQKSYGRMYFSLGSNEVEEVADIYGILNYIVEKDIQIQFGVASAYSLSNNYQDKVKGFNDRVVLVLIRHIEGYLTKIGIDMGIDENISYSIEVHGGQVNLASNNAVINATQNNGINTKQLAELIMRLRETIPTEMPKDDINTVNDCIETIKAESNSQTPKKGLLRTAIRGLQVIKGGVEFTAAVTSVADFVQALL